MPLYRKPGPLAQSLRGPAPIEAPLEIVDTGTTGPDSLVGTRANDTLSGGDGQDTINGFGGGDRIDGGSDDDLIDGGFGADLAWGGIGAGADTMDGGGGHDQLYGEDGADWVRGGAGSDTTFGGAGDDRLEGGDGHDYLAPGTGADTISGGRGGDVLDYASAEFASVWVDLEAGFADDGASVDTLLWIETVRGSFGSDDLRGDNRVNHLIGFAGHDMLVGRGGNDNLEGFEGRDTLIGGRGADLLSGDAGVDRFVYRSVADSPGTSSLTVDWIFGLDTQDVIDLSAIDANTGKGGDQDFVLVEAFTGTAGELTLVQETSFFTTLLGDVNGDSIADFSVRLSGEHTDYANFAL